MDESDSVRDRHTMSSQWRTV